MRPRPTPTTLPWHSRPPTRPPVMPVARRLMARVRPVPRARLVARRPMALRVRPVAPRPGLAVAPPAVRVPTPRSLVLASLPLALPTPRPLTLVPAVPALLPSAQRRPQRRPLAPPGPLVLLGVLTLRLAPRLLLRPRPALPRLLSPLRAPPRPPTPLRPVLPPLTPVPRLPTRLTPTSPRTRRPLQLVLPTPLPPRAPPVTPMTMTPPPTRPPAPSPLRDDGAGPGVAGRRSRW